MESNCHHCKTPFSWSETDRVGFRDCCLKCGRDLHCCRNCRFYDLASYNECKERQAERQVDKERGNFCEYFKPAATNSAPPTAPTGGDAKSKLDDLFK